MAFFGFLRSVSFFCVLWRQTDDSEASMGRHAPTVLALFSVLFVSVDSTVVVVCSFASHIEHWQLQLAILGQQ
jgi:hypothetical protein